MSINTLFWKRNAVALLCMASLVVLVLPQPVQAQKEYSSLYLNLRNGQDYYNYDARAGQVSKYFLEVRNNGTTNISNFKVSTEAPEGWLINISPSEIKLLAPGNLATLDVNIEPVGTATAQGYQVTFIAQSTEIPRQVQTYTITVKPATSWIWVWSGVVLLVIAGFILIYLRMNKQEK